MNQSYPTHQQHDPNNFRPWGMDEKQYLLLMHLSQFAGYVFPLAGIILPIVMWSTNKDFSKHIDEHGKMIINFMISFFIYFIISFILVFVFIGFFLLIILGICSIVFTIIGAIRANEGRFYRYPLTIDFIK